MNVSVVIEANAQRKREIQQNLTARLPDWFGQAKANLRYAEQAEVLTGYVALVDGKATGMLLLKKTNPISGEIYWMGVDPEFHRRGVGRALVDAACALGLREAPSPTTTPWNHGTRRRARMFAWFGRRRSRRF